MMCTLRRHAGGRGRLVKPNIILVVFDTARADAFDPYGAPRGTTPSVAQLASRGEIHYQLYSSGCWTVPAHASMFSGLLPRTAGLGHSGSGTPGQFRVRLRTLEDRLLPQVLRRNGYETKGLSANPWVSSATGFDTGFDEFTFVQSKRRGYGYDGELSTNLWWYLQALRARIDDGAEEIERTLERWVAQPRRRPFFWFVNLIECHSPYLPPRPHSGLAALDRVRAAREARVYLSLGNIWRCNVAELNIPEPALQRMRRLYRGAIRQMDGWLARVLDALERNRLLDETQVVVTSDHGENFGEAGKLGHSFSLDDRLLRLPFVTAGPARLTIPAPAGIGSIPRWLMGVAGIDDHPYQDEHPYQGVGDDETGGSRGDGTAGIAVAQFDAPGIIGHPRITEAMEAWKLSGPLAEHASRAMCESFSCATNGALKLLRFDSREELVDLAADPLEVSPLPVGPAEEARFGERLRALRAALDRAQREERPPMSEEADGQGPVSPTETAELEAQMRRLGYL
jgi:hypothetical protein